MHKQTTKPPPGYLWLDEEGNPQPRHISEALAVVMADLAEKKRQKDKEKVKVA